MKAMELQVPLLYVMLNVISSFSLGEMVDRELITRFCDYLFEMMLIDDDKESYILSEHCKESQQILILLQRLSEFR